jgi:hypothetical protein
MQTNEFNSSLSATFLFLSEGPHPLFSSRAPHGHAVAPNSSGTKIRGKVGDRTHRYIWKCGSSWLPSDHQSAKPGLVAPVSR